MLAGMITPASKRARSPEMLKSKNVGKKSAKLTSSALHTIQKDHKLGEKANVLQVRKKAKTVKPDRMAI